MQNNHQPIPSAQKVSRFASNVGRKVKALLGMRDSADRNAEWKIARSDASESRTVIAGDAEGIGVKAKEHRGSHLLEIRLKLSRRSV
jgi:hypothetical protein